MENYFTYILNLMNYISKKESEIIELNVELKKIKEEKNIYLDLLIKENAKISAILLHEEERDEELKFLVLPIALVFIFTIIILIMLNSRIFNIKILFLIIPIILSFPICKKLSSKTKEKYNNLRIARKDIIEKEEKNRKQLLEKYNELNAKENKIAEQLKKLENDIKTKKEHKERLEREVITRLAPTLDRLINDEITKNDNHELEEILKRIREI